MPAGWIYSEDFNKQFKLNRDFTSNQVTDPFPCDNIIEDHREKQMADIDETTASSDKFNDGLSDTSDASDSEASSASSPAGASTGDEHCMQREDVSTDTSAHVASTPSPPEQAFCEATRNTSRGDPDKPLDRLTEKSSFAFFKDKFIINCNNQCGLVDAAAL